MLLICVPFFSAGARGKRAARFVPAHPRRIPAAEGNSRQENETREARRQD